MRDTIKALRIILDLLDRFSQAELNDLASGKAKLKIEYPHVKSTQPQSLEDISELSIPLSTFTTIEDAKTFFVSKNFNKATLRRIADKYQVVLMSKDTNEQIIDKIVERLIGSKLRYDSLLNMDTK